MNLLETEEEKAIVANLADKMNLNRLMELHLQMAFLAGRNYEWKRLSVLGNKISDKPVN